MTSSGDLLQIHAAAANVIKRGMELLQEQCAGVQTGVSRLRRRFVCCVPKLPASPRTRLLAPAAADDAADTVCRAEAVAAALLTAPVVAVLTTAASAASQAALAVTCDAALAAASLTVPDIEVQPVDPCSTPTNTPRSALTTAFTLLRQSSSELVAEAAAVAATIAETLAEQQQATLSAFNLAADHVRQPSPRPAA